MTPSKTAASKPTTPAPADAVAKDAHWSATLERLKARQRPVATLTICDDLEVKQELADARTDRAKAQMLADAEPDDPEAQQALVAAGARLINAQKAYDEVVIVLRFQALERTVLDALMDAHKPTEQQAEEGYDYNKDTLSPLLVSESSMDGMTPEDAQYFLDTWGKSEAEALINTVFGVQRHIRMDLGKG